MSTTRTSSTPVPLAAPAFPEPRRSRLAQALVVATLVGGLAAPMVAQIGKFAPTGARREFRHPANLPKRPASLAQLDAFPRQFDLWYQDAFGLRTTFIRGFNRSMILGLGESPTEKLLLGKDRWIFHRESGAVEMYRGTMPFTEQDMEAWAESLQQRSDWLAAEGRLFVYAPLPSKFEVYPEQLPDRLTDLGPSRRDQLLDYLRENTTVLALDVLPALLRAKERDQPGAHAYFPFGVHWTDLGAIEASVHVVEQLIASGIRAGDPVRFDDYQVVPLGRAVDSWARRLYVEDHYPETQSGLRPDFQPAAKRRHLKRARANADRRYEQDAPELPTIAVYHDSNGKWILPFLAESFRELYALRHTYFEPLLIEELAPDVVLQLQTERILFERSPMLQTHMADATYRSAFEASEDVRIRTRPAAGATLTRYGDDTSTASPTASGALRLTITSGRHELRLPKFEPGQDHELLLLRLDLQVRRPGTLHVLYKLQGQRSFQTTRTYPVETRRGRHAYFVPLSIRGAEGEVALHLGGDSAKFVLHSTEVRAVPRPAWRPADARASELNPPAPSSK